MNNTSKLFLAFIRDSVKEIKNNFSVYLVYIIFLSLVSVVQNSVDFVLGKDDLLLRTISKILFSVVPILILSKILYIIKIRNTGMGDYRKLLGSFLLYNLYYFLLFVVSFLVYLIPAGIVSEMTNSSLGFLAMAFLLIPLIYIMIFYSLTPFVAVFEDAPEKSLFSISKTISKKNIALVMLNHASSLLIPLIFSLLFMVKSPMLKLSLAAAFSIPESILSIVMTLTTAKVYFYLSDLE